MLSFLLTAKAECPKAFTTEAYASEKILSFLKYFPTKPIVKVSF